MREIKFKFIIERYKLKYLSESYTLTNDDGLPPEEQILEDMEGSCTCNLNESVNYCEGGCIEWDEATVIGKVQYTGLKDKNGKEIYEGDIVRQTGEVWEDSWGKGWKVKEFPIGKIYYSAPVFNIEQIKIGSAINTDGKTSELNLSCYDGLYMWQGETSCLEIIGNIYENSELIKEK